MNGLMKLLGCGLLLVAGQALGQTVEYIHTDALGSPVAITDALGNVVEREVYEPYGAASALGATDAPGFTGHVADSRTGLSYMQQRYYDPQLAVFLSVDPITAEARVGDVFNRYGYVINNPYRFIDPDGRCEKATGSAICGGSGFSGSRVLGGVGPPSVRAGDDAPRTTLTTKPVSGKINSRDPGTRTADGGYDPTGAKRLRSNGARRHQGVDIGAPVGTPVVAAAPGWAQNKSDPDGYGIYIDVSHGEGLSTRYAHLRSSSVSNGQFVSGGDKIGEVGRSGNLSPQTQSHLHFEVRDDSVPQDPLTWFDYDY